MIPWNLEILRNELIGLMLSLEGKSAIPRMNAEI